MDDHIHVPMLLITSILTICFLILTTIPQSLSQQDDRYRVCSEQYSCGQLSSISYPFWGNYRPDYCGGGDQFWFICDGQENTSIQMFSQNLIVLDINRSDETMRLRTQLAHDVCSDGVTNITLDNSVFHYSDNVQNINIFYDCPSSVVLDKFNSSIFRCPHGTSQNLDLNIFLMDGNQTVFQQLQACRRGIQVPVSGIVNGSMDALRQALNDGFEVKYVNANVEQCKMCEESGGACGRDNTVGDQFSCYCPNGYQDLLCNGRSKMPTKITGNFSISMKIIIGVSAAMMGGFMMCIIACCCRYKSSSREAKFWFMTKHDKDIEAFLKNHEALAQKRYKFSEVKRMTNSFKVKLGQGGFGAVYKGQLHPDCPVAVKILNASKGNGKDFMNEVASISKTSHVNVVTLLGFCLEGHKKALIYEFMPNGSLDKFIYNKGLETTSLLSWDNLLQIALGIARGLEYLHRGCNTRILHLDIKPHIILLDENYCPKISDFGLAKLCLRKESIVSMSDAKGTMGYIAPEMWNRHFGGVSHKSDVYSYGMMLLEMVGGRKNINVETNHTSEIYFPHWVYNRLEQGNDLRPDSVMDSEENNIARRMTVVGLWCTQTIPNDRPTMGRVIDMLEGHMDSLEMPPKPVLSSPTRSVPESSST